MVLNRIHRNRKAYLQNWYDCGRNSALRLCRWVDPHFSNACARMRRTIRRKWPRTSLPDGVLLITDDDDPTEVDDPTVPVVNPILPTEPIKPITDESLDRG
jgi:hypothetical protein